MNHPMTTQHQRNVPNGAIDVWSQGQNPTQLGMPSPQQHGPTPASPVAVVQRLLRGRVALAVVLAGIGALIGGAAGYMSQAPIYKAVGQIEINPITPLAEGDKAMPYYVNFMGDQALTIKSPSVLKDVPKYEPWKSLYGNAQGPLDALAANLQTEYVKNTFGITIENDDATSAAASAGVESTILAYQAQYKNNSQNMMASKIGQLDMREKNLLAKKADNEKVINDITAIYGSADLQQMVTASQQKLEETDRQRRDYENNLNAAKDAIEAGKNGGTKLSVEDLAQVDVGLAKLVSDERADEIREQLMEKQLGANHPTVRQLRTAIEVEKAAIDATADSIRKEVLGIIPDFVKGGYMEVTPGALSQLETRVATLKSDEASYQKEHDQIAQDAGKVAFAQTYLKQIGDDLTKLGTQQDAMTYQAAMTGDLKIMANGAFAAKASDKKILFGLAGALVGGFIPVGILMLLGLMDTRFRYSDDAAGQSMAGIPLLGILPNLPDRLSDPAQASIAAHCVHQIRTMLQLNAMHEQATAFAITSASSGDGKTSLSLALGLSFAASGSRTLLIDADLVGGGLTSRLGNTSAAGIIDALAGVGLEECVQPTDVADLSLLPIGGAQAHHAGSFSPPAVRKLLSEIRKHYEVIIIDTGPVMGSIEATPICASVDGVVLTVARGQSRPLVERAITHLQSIGARVAGVVFNRAQHKDFEQSIGAISIRSAARSTANGTGHNGRGNADMGAVAKAVATSVRSDN